MILTKELNRRIIKVKINKLTRKYSKPITPSCDITIRATLEHLRKTIKYKL